MWKLIMAAWAIFIAGTLLSCLCSGRWLAAGETNIINALSSFNTTEISAWDAPKTITSFWNATVTALSWNYPYLQSSWAFPVRMICWIITFGVVFGLIQLFISVIQALMTVFSKFF